MEPTCLIDWHDSRGLQALGAVIAFKEIRAEGDHVILSIEIKAQTIGELVKIGGGGSKSLE
jgi:hypothetical protein